MTRIEFSHDHSVRVEHGMAACLIGCEPMSASQFRAVAGPEWFLARSLMSILSRHALTLASGESALPSSTTITSKQSRGYIWPAKAFKTNNQLAGALIGRNYNGKKGLRCVTKSLALNQEPAMSRILCLCYRTCV